MQCFTDGVFEARRLIQQRLLANRAYYSFWLALAGLLACSCECPRHPGSGGAEVGIDLGKPACAVAWVEARYTLSGAGLTAPIRGSLPIAPDGSTPASLALLPQGTYNVALQVFGAAGEGLCRGSLGFDVPAGQTAKVRVPLNCDAACGGGGPNPSCEPAQSPKIEAAHVSPKQASVASGSFVLNAQATDPQGDPLSYEWDGKGLSIQQAGQTQARARCLWVGKHEVTLKVSDASGCSAVERSVVSCTQEACDPSRGDTCGVVSSVGGNLVDPPGVPKIWQCPFTDALALVNTGASCPAQLSSTAGSWIGEELSSAPEGKYCHYSWRGQLRGGPADPSALARAFPANRWQPDCPIASNSGMDSNLAEHFEKMGREHLGWPTSSVRGQHAVRIAVVDTAAHPFGSLTSDHDAHGRTVGLVAKDTACAGVSWAECPVRISNHLAMPYWTDREPVPSIHVDTVNGGSFGTRWQLAQAVRGAVDAWRAGASAERLLINLSVAWSPVWGGGLSQNLRGLLAQQTPTDPVSTTDKGVAAAKPKAARASAQRLTVFEQQMDRLLATDFEFGSRVVQESLYYAACHGALILAASGNDDLEPTSPEHPAGPMLPAAWTALPAPSVAACAARGVTLAQEPEPGAALLYAVGAADFGAQPLLTRPEGQSALVGLGFQAVRQDPVRGGFTPALSGSSMSTAALSGIAALAWSAEPKLSPHGVIKSLYAASKPLTPAGAPLRADFCPASRCGDFPEARSVTLCAIPGQKGCVAPAPLPELEINVPVVEYPQATPAPPEAAALTLVPAWNQVPWVIPQPDDDPQCTVCTFKKAPERLDASMTAGFKLLTSSWKLKVNSSSVGFTPGGDNFSFTWAAAPSGPVTALFEYRVNTGVLSYKMLEVVTILQ